MTDKLEIVIKSDVIAEVHTIYMPIAVMHDSQIDYLCDFLRSAGQKDAVVMYLGNYGGSCHAGQRLLNALADSQARTTMITDSPCYSMGALLAISCDSLQMHQGSMLMFHNYSSMAYGKGGEMLEQIKQHDVWLKDQQFATCFPFLTKAEIKRLEKDQDIYIHWNDPSVSVRMDRHVTYQNKHRRRIYVGV